MKESNNKQVKKNRIETPEGKFAKQFKLVYDMQSMPQGLATDMFAKLCDSGFIFYDSDKGNRPKLYTTGEANGEDKLVPVFVDTEGKEVDIEDFKAKMEDEEFWRKEIYKCKQSPLYYFSNYASPDLQPSKEATDAFLDSIGFGASDDSEDAATVNEKTRKIREEYAASITLDQIKSLKPVRDRMDEEYQMETQGFIKEFADLHGFTETNVIAIKPKLITTLMKIKPKDAPEKLKYYLIEKTGRWDKALMKAEELGTLIRLWKAL